MSRSIGSHIPCVVMVFAGLTISCALLPTIQSAISDPKRCNFALAGRCEALGVPYRPARVPGGPWRYLGDLRVDCGPCAACGAFSRRFPSRISPDCYEIASGTLPGPGFHRVGSYTGYSENRREIQGFRLFSWILELFGIRLPARGWVVAGAFCGE